jgi:hypothetical protein
MRPRSLLILAAVAVFALIAWGLARPEPASAPMPVPPVPSSPTAQLPSDKVELVPAARLGEAFTLAVGDARVFESGLLVQLLIVNDSRCPKDVVCVWAGELSPVLKVSLLDQAGSSQELTLGSTTKRSAEAHGYAFGLQAATETTATVIVRK